MKPIVLVGNWIVKAPIQNIYKIVTDFENAHKYFPIVAGTLKITSKKGNHLTINAISKTFCIPFLVQMETDLLPNQGFKSTNTSALAIEDESFLMEEVPTGTKITYRNEVQIKNNFLQLFAKILIGKPALLFWKYAYTDRLQKLADKTR